jgi:hypothetical protein
VFVSGWWCLICTEWNDKKQQNCGQPYHSETFMPHFSNEKFKLGHYRMTGSLDNSLAAPDRLEILGERAHIAPVHRGPGACEVVPEQR